MNLIKFKAEWCGPCKASIPVIESLKEHYGDDVQFTEVDINEQPALLHEWQIRSIPTFLLVKDITEVARRSGCGTVSEMVEWIDGYRNLQPQILPDPSSGVPGASRIVLCGAGEQENAAA